MRMRKKILIVGGALIILAVSSVYFYSRLTQPSPPQTDIENAVITMERSVCFGGCPVYNLTIFGDGRVVYEGIKFVNATGTRTAQISREKIRELFGEFYKIGYFSLKGRYIEKCDIFGCKRISDLPTTITSITVGGKTKKVIDYYGAPQKLKELESEIDEIADSQKWVKKMGQE